MKLKVSQIKAYRETAVRKQKGICPLCKEELRPEDAVLDHCHKTGKVRKALHRSCNAAEGRILHWAGVRSRGDDPVEFVGNLMKYWKADYSGNPLHHTHGRVKRKRKRQPRMKKARGIR
jgi:predicted amidophosphoribosyltransferase